MRLDANVLSAVSTKNILLQNSGGTIDTNGHNYTPIGAISGTGTLNKTGLGTLTLYNLNTYSGGTNINEGMLAGNTNGLQGDITNNAEVQFIQSGDGTYEGVMDGTGSLIKSGVGILTLSGENTYSGGTDIGAGTLALANENAIGTGDIHFGESALRTDLDMTLENNIELIFGTATIDTNNHSLLLNGTISGAGTFTKDGEGLLVLNGINSYTGGTTINAGELRIGDADHETAMITSNVLVSAGILSGHGTITGNITNAGGTVAPGGSVGTLAVNGNYTQGSAGTLAIDVTPGASSLLAVTGTASLAGKLALNFADGAYGVDSYRFLTANAISGTFDDVVVDAPAGYAFNSLLYGSNAISFSLLPLIPEGASFYGSSTHVQFNASHAAAEHVFDHLSDAWSGTAAPIPSLAQNAFATSGASGPMVDVQRIVKMMPRVAQEYGGWFKATGNLSTLDSSAAVDGYESLSGGAMFGVDKLLDKNTRVGLMAGYERTAIDGYAAVKNKTESDAVRLGFYRSKKKKNSTFDFQLGYALHMMESQRFVTANSTTATADHNAHEFSAGFQLSEKIKRGTIQFTPKIGANFTHIYEEGFTETNAGLFNAAIAEKGTNSLRPFVGFSLSAPGKFTPELHAKYSYEALDASSNTNATVFGNSFSVNGLAPSRHNLAIGAGFTFKLDKDIDAFGSYDVQVPLGNSFEQSFSAGMNFRF